MEETPQKILFDKRIEHLNSKNEQIYFWKLTGYKKIFLNTYWGGFGEGSISNDTFQMIQNRNKFVRKFNIHKHINSDKVPLWIFKHIDKSIGITPPYSNGNKKYSENICLHLITANLPVRSPIPGASIWYRYTPYAISKLSLDNIFHDSVPFSKTSS